MSDVRSTHLRDARPNRRHGNVPKLQCCGHRSERFYLTSASSAPRRCPLTSSFAGKVFMSISSRFHPSRQKSKTTRSSWSLAFTPILARSSRRSALHYSHSKSPRSSQCSAAQAAKIFSSFAVLLLPPVSPVKQNRPCRAPALLQADNGTIPSSFQIGVPEKVLDIFQFARFLIHQ